MEKLLVSACLLGASCRYDGKGAPLVDGMRGITERFETVPFCPEIYGGLPTPRTPCEITGERVISKNGDDFTKNYDSGAREALRLCRILGIKKALLKEKSPSCGKGKIYDGTFTGGITAGNGISAALLIENGITVFGESEIDKIYFGADSLKLIKPSAEYADDIMSYREEFCERGDSMDGCCGLDRCASADEWLLRLGSMTEEKCPSGLVPSDTYIAVRERDCRIVGMVDFRHHINHPALGVWGGHIGYSVRPGERRQGYAKEMLRLVLEKCRDFGLPEVLVTCGADNEGSRRTIIANGGAFENTVDVDGESVMRYWIKL